MIFYIFDFSFWLLVSRGKYNQYLKKNNKKKWIFKDILPLPGKCLIIKVSEIITPLYPKD